MCKYCYILRFADAEGRFTAAAMRLPTTINGTRLATVTPNIDAMTIVHTGQRDATRPSSQRPTWAYVMHPRIHRDQSGAKKNAYL